MYVTHSVRASGDSSDLFLERELLLSVYALPRNTSKCAVVHFAERHLSLNFNE